MKSIGQRPHQKHPTLQNSPNARAATAARKSNWTFREIPGDVSKLVAAAIEEFGGDKKYWVEECVRAGLAKYAGKRGTQPRRLNEGSFR